MTKTNTDTLTRILERLEGEEVKATWTVGKFPEQDIEEHAYNSALDLVKEIIKEELSEEWKKKQRHEDKALVLSLANKLLRFLANEYPNKKHCAFIEEEVCGACAEKVAIVKFLLSRENVQDKYHY